MFGLPIGFAAPFILTALVALPVLYYLLRLTPPPPRRVALPTLALVRDLDKREEMPAHTPWWLLLLRLLIAAMVILAMAGPLLRPEPAAVATRGPMLLVIDNGWAAAPDWRLRIERAEALIGAAERDGRPVALRATADQPADIVPAAASRASEVLRGLQPMPHTPDHARHEAAITAFLERDPRASLVWLSDGVVVGPDPAVLTRLAGRFGDRMSVFMTDAPRVLALAGPSNAAEALTIRVLRAAASAPAVGTLRAIDSRGRALGETRFSFESALLTSTARFDLPLELRNEIARVEIAEQQSAGAVALLDSRNKRRRVGVVSGETTDTAQPLVSPTYFVTRALGPFADIREAPRGASDPYGRLIEDGATVLVLADVGTLSGAALDRLRTFVDEGGVLIRFASRRVASPTDALMPVRLRRSERVMGGALSWDTPRKLGGFQAGSPFDGLAVPPDVTVTHQILAEPDAQLTEKSWAVLEDGTPLITGEKRGRGAVVLFHVTADTAWSTLPLSGAFVETLRRVVALAQTGNDQREQAGGAAETVQPQRVLDGFGAFRAPPVTAQGVLRTATQPASALHPPGFYGPIDAQIAINTLSPEANLVPLDTSGLSLRPLESRPPVDLRPHLLTLALALFLVDAVIAMALSGALAAFGFGRRRAAAALVGAGLIGLSLVAATDGLAQTLPAAPPPSGQPRAPVVDTLPSYRADDIEAALVTRFGYVLTGDREIDEISRQGLFGLTRAMATRTALEPGEPIGLDPARDELVFYPLLYWPMAPNRPPPSDAAIRRIDAYMKQGGTIIFDTRDALAARPGAGTSPETQLLRRILGNLDLPDLEPVPKDHVVTKTFYLLDGFVGRYASGQTWIEVLQRNTEGDRQRPAQAGDRVSPIIITSNDLAAAWAIDRNGQPRFPLVPGDARQREMAIRGGVNIVMYAMTGNYKADQVHVPALLERLGQ
jgi:hypothetical protein